ncbi:MAG: NUDIX hydrolase [Actinobacteria bacterium]|jgi:ADP-ribose pyrophosphatase|nr:NUDIX hydrolase [Actinomycetota bacterium]MCL5885596.1 NUDIX hydrolase [Actinomycetota bacterium]
MNASFIKQAESVEYSGKRIDVVHTSIIAPDGTSYIREIVKHPGAVVIVPVDSEGKVHLLRQYRAPLDAELIEIPAGTMDVAGEAPEDTAARELREELGLIGSKFDLLATVYNSPGFCTEKTYIYLATGLVQDETAREGPEEKYMSVFEISLDEAIRLCIEGEIHDAQTIIGLMLAARRIAGDA